MDDLMKFLHLEINARKKEYHPFMRIAYKNDTGLNERWRDPTFVDLIETDSFLLESWTKKIRTAVLNTTPVCLVSNNLFYLLNSKLFPLSDYIILCYAKYWYENSPVYIILFNYPFVDVSVKKYGFILSPTRLDITK